jgi:hypothetical protein
MKKRNKMFYQFRQNNSGGSFVYDEKAGISVNVIVEAKDYLEANDLAERIGIYFDGCNSGLDCPCCGDRWSDQWHEDGHAVPSHYGEPIDPATFSTKDQDFGIKWMEEYEGFIHYADGTIVGYDN